jgi:hypothetical protein
MLGFKTIRQGERVAIWNSHGEIKIVDGPKKLFLFNEQLENLKIYTAEPDEYLIISYKDGRKEHLKGAVSIWFDPIIHQSIQIQKMINLEENEIMVVYAKKDDRVIKRIIKGADTYMPTENEWTHEFSWHGSIESGISNKKLPHVLKFKKLRVIPDQMYFDVEDVRTSDDALIIVKVMIFFEIVNIDLMLIQTHDPIADFINALTSDIIDFVSGLSFEEFKENTDKLNNLETYKQLVSRSEKIGYQINKVVYRGYTANNRLQEMHNNAIEARTKLKLETETETQAQQLSDYKLGMEFQRSVKKREMEENEISHKNKMSKIVHDETMRQLQVEKELKLQEEKAKNDLALENKIKYNHAEKEILFAMKNMNVDLTKYLVSKYQKIDNLVKIDTENDYKPNLHIHE